MTTPRAAADVPAVQVAGVRRRENRLADRALVTAGEYAYRRPDGVAVVPFALLGP